MLVPLKVQYAVHHVLQNLGACNGTLFVDMADDEHRDPLTLGYLHQCHGAVLHLADAACRRVGGPG